MEFRHLNLKNCFLLSSHEKYKRLSFFLNFLLLLWHFIHYSLTCVPIHHHQWDSKTCRGVAKWWHLLFKGGRGMSTNGKACYDKLDKAIVALSWLDDCRQSTSLRAFFFLLLAGDSVTSFQNRSWGATDTPTHNHTPPSTPITPIAHHPYQRLSVICGQMKGGMWFWREKNKEKKKCKKPMKCKGTENSWVCVAKK